MESIVPFIYYLTAIRLGIIVAGIVCIVLGYRLFMHAIPSHDKDRNHGQDESVFAEFVGSKLSIRNASPGTCFALFGAFMIVMMYVTGGPEATLDIIEKGRVRATFRGQTAQTVENTAWQAVQELKSGEKEKAFLTANQLLKRLAGPINNIALVLVAENPENTKAAYLAKLAVSIDPQNPDFINTLQTVKNAK